MPVSVVSWVLPVCSECSPATCANSAPSNFNRGSVASVEDRPGCEYLLKINLGDEGPGSLLSGFRLGKNLRFRVSPLPPTSERLDWGGVCKSGVQNLEPQRFRGQNLESKGVIAIPKLLVRTASALTIICSSNSGVKVRCHMDCVENARTRFRSNLPYE